MANMLESTEPAPSLTEVKSVGCVPGGICRVHAV